MRIAFGMTQWYTPRTGDEGLPCLPGDSPRARIPPLLQAGDLPRWTQRTCQTRERPRSGSYRQGGERAPGGDRALTQQVSDGNKSQACLWL